MQRKGPSQRLRTIKSFEAVSSPQMTVGVARLTAAGPEIAGGLSFHVIDISSSEEERGREGGGEPATSSPDRYFRNFRRGCPAAVAATGAPRCNSPLAMREEIPPPAKRLPPAALAAGEDTGVASAARRSSGWTAARA